MELIIIGGGPIGIACGLEAKKKGISYLILEKGPIVNSLFNYPVNMQFFSSSERLEIDDIPFISKEAKPKRNEALEYYRRIVTSNQLNIHLARSARPGDRITAEARVLSQGRRTALLESRLTDEEGRLVALVTASCLFVEDQR